MTVTLDGKTVNCSQLTEKLIIAASNIDKWENTERKRKFRVYGAVREWTLKCFEMVTWGSSVVKDFQDMIGQNTKRTFVVDEGERFQLNEQVFIDDLNNDLSQSRKNLRHFTLKLIEERFTPALNESLVLSLPFNEGQGSVAGDKSAYANDGTLYNSPSWIDGKVGKALSFDGSTNFVRVPHQSHLALPAFTVAFWCKWKDATPPTTFKSVVDKGRLNLKDWWFSQVKDTWQMQINYGDGALYPRARGGDFSDNLFHHLVGTYNNRTIKLFVDNVKVEENTGSTDIVNDTLDLYVACRQDQAALANVDVDALLIFNRELSISEINFLYKAGAYIHGRPLQLGDIRENDGAASFKVDMWESQAYIRQITNYGKVKRWRLICFEKDVEWDDSTYRKLRELAESGTLTALELLDDLSGRVQDAYITDLTLRLYPLSTHNIRDFTVQLQEE